MTRAPLSVSQLRALSAAKATQLLAEQETPPTEAAYLALAADVEREITLSVAHMDPPDMRTWREVVAELRRRAWRLPHDTAG